MTEYDKMTKAELIEELRKKERLFSSVYELVASSDDAIIGKSLDGTISSWNKGAENIYGYSAREIIDQNITILSPPDHHDEVLRILEKIKRGERIKHFETVRVTKEGEQLHVSLNISPIINAAGEITGTSTIARDITERKQMEQKLAKVASFPMLIPHPVMEVDLDGRVSFANPAARRLFPDLVQRGSDHPWLAGWESLVASCRDRGENPDDREVAVAGRWYHQTMYYVPEEQRLRIYGFDITKRNRIENIMQARLRLLEYANSHSMDELLTATLDEIEALTGSTIGFYHFLESDQKTLSLQNWSTNTLKTMCTAAGKGSHYDIAQAGVWVECVYERRPVIHNDYASLPHRKGMPEGHAPVVRELVVPIFRDNLIKAIIGVGNKSANYNENDIETVSQLGDLSLDIAERKRAEEALREKTEELHRYFTNALDLLCIADTDGYFRRLNPEWEARLGFSVSELEGRRFLDFVHPDDMEATLQALSQLTEQKEVLNFVNRYRCKNGSYRWIEWRSFPSGTRIYAVARDITETMLAERELQQSNSLLRTIIEAAPTAIIGIDLDGNVQMVWNPAAEKMLGWSAREVMGHPLPSVPVESREEFRSFRERIRRGMTLNGVEVRRQRRDGTLIDYSIYASPLHDPEGRIIGNISVLAEITERKRMEEELRLAHDELEERVVERTKQLEKTAEALRTSEERYALAVQGSNDGIWDINLVSGEVYFSPRWKSMLGYEDDKIPNDVEEWKKRIHPDDRHMVMEARKACLDGHIPTYEIEYRLQHKDGSFRWIHSRGACLRDLERKPTRFAGSHSDITDRKRIEDIVRESEKKYRTLFEESKDTIFISDPARRIIDINQAGIELFGYTKEELFSLDLEKLYCNREDRKVLWQKLYRFGFVNDFEAEMKRKDGEKIIVHLSMSVLKDDAEQISGYQGIIRDVTERKRLERQLLQSQKMESVGILAGGVAHEFNNLLTAISGYGQILQERIPEDDELSRESIANVIKATERATDLTRGLLAFSRKQLISPKPVNIDTLISNTGKIIQMVIGEDVEFSTSFSAENLLLKADPGQIEQVLMNMATNARDAMPHGGHLSVTTRQVVVKEGSEAQYDLPEPGKYALISVVDTGTGIDTESLKSIFEPFYTTKEVGKGTGLGLSIAHGIIKQHNGSILASSEPGKGTSFDIYLPLVKGHVVKEESKISALHPGGTETLLVVEDDETVRMFIKKILERAGYKVIIADDGEDAMARFQENDEISVVLSDVVMPRKNGREMLDEIRKIKPGIKVVFISGYAADIMQKKGMTEEGTEFITKPFIKEELLQKVREVLDKDLHKV